MPNVTLSTAEVNETLKCVAFGVPQPQIRWEKVGEMTNVCITNSLHHKQSVHSVSNWQCFD
jgi:hypothetical protein